MAEEITTEDAQVRLAMSLSEADAKRLKLRAMEAGIPGAVLSRALVKFGLDRWDTPEVAAAVAQAAEAERTRRRAAGAVGGKRGAITRRQKAATKKLSRKENP